MKKAVDRRKEFIQAQLTLIFHGEIHAAIPYWQALSVNLMSIIGEEGFLVLYKRSVYLLRDAFPTLQDEKSEITTHTWLTDLENSLSNRDHAEADSANQQLLMNFTNILASLIGEDLTVEILQSSWSDMNAKKIL